MLVLLLPLVWDLRTVMLKRSGFECSGLGGQSGEGSAGV